MHTWLDDQIAWYDVKSRQSQRWFKALEICQPLLAERVEGLVSQEHATWVSHREEGRKRIGGGE